MRSVRQTGTKSNPEKKASKKKDKWVHISSRKFYLCYFLIFFGSVLKRWARRWNNETAHLQAQKAEQFAFKVIVMNKIYSNLIRTNEYCYGENRQMEDFPIIVVEQR